MTTTNPAPYLAIATDSFLSGWGGAIGRTSIIVYECRDEHEQMMCVEYLCGRKEMKRVRSVCEGRKAYAPRNAHVSRLDAGKVHAVRFYRECKASDAALLAARVGGAS